MSSSEPKKDVLKIPDMPALPKLPKAAGGAKETATASLTGDETAAGVASSPWFWAAVALGVVALGAALWWWWKKKQADAPAPAAKGPDLYHDWRGFRAQLPRRLRRVLDEFQPVVVLGTVAGEKERIVGQLSGVDRNEQLYPGQVVFKGEVLEVILGARCVVLMPSEQFLAAASSSTDPGWKKVLRHVSRVHAPRVLVCLSQGAIESSDLDRLGLWSAHVRAHIETICEVRDANIEVEVVLAQSPQSAPSGNSASPRITDAFFELLWALSGDPKYQRLLNIPLLGIGECLGQGEERRKQDAQVWIAERLVDCRRGWPRLLGSPEQSAKGMLRLAGLFEEFDQLTSSLGVALAELFVVNRGQVRFGLGQTLRVLPFRDGQFCGNLPLFDGIPTPGSVRWHPTLPLIHRLGIATGAGLLTLGVLSFYFHDRQEWLDAVNVVRFYVPTKPGQRFPIVEKYFTNAAGSVGFFDRDRLRCRVVKGVREYLEPKIAHSLAVPEEPERVMQLVSLYVTGAPNDCDIDEGHPAYRHYQRLSDTIIKHIDQWRQTTALSDAEIRTYLLFSCPKEDAPMDMLSEFKRKSQDAVWSPTPALHDFAESLESLTGECPLTAHDRDAVGRAEVIARAMSEMEGDHSAALAVLDAMGRLDTVTMNKLTRAFSPYRARLERLAELGDQSEEVNALMRDILPYEEKSPRFSLGNESALRAFKGRLDANFGELQVQRYKLRLSTARRTFIVDRRDLRKVLQLRAVERLEGKLFTAVKGQEDLYHTPEVLFFTPQEYNRSVEWTGKETWPTGVGMHNSVPWRYTQEGFKWAIQGPLTELANAQRASLCDEPGGKDQEHLTAFIRERLVDYLGAYSRTWRDVYHSFSLRLLSEEALGRTLRALAQPSSPLVALVQQTATQVQLPEDVDFPFSGALNLAGEGLDTLESAAQEKALGGYRALVQEMADAVQAEPPAAPPSPKEGQPDPTLARASFAAGLSSYGLLTWGGALEPEQEIRGKFRTWAKDSQLARSLQRPLMEPFLAAHRMGVRDLDHKLAVWWRPFERRLNAELLALFPFNRAAQDEADVLKVIEWLHPLDGRLVNEIQPIVDALTGCSEVPCPTVPKSAQSMLVDLTRVQRALFDEKGGAKALSVEIEPRPFSPQALSPKASVITVNGTSLRYFNTRPKVDVLELAWNEAYVSELSVEVVGEGGSTPPTTLITQKSAWSFLRLLEKGAPEQGARYTWHLSNNRPGLLSGVSVSYDVCGGVRKCDGLFSDVFKWR